MTSSSSSPPARPIRRLLVCNRGEIAVRILHAARELSSQIETFAIHTADDTSHCESGRSHHALQIPSPATYLDVSYLVQLAKERRIDAVHPGYGFLSESADFASRMWHEAGAVVIGPGWDVLRQTGDKLQARRVAHTCGVPILPAMTLPTADLEEIKKFAAEVGYPVMIKAVDGGGGRGIRLVRTENDLPNAVSRAVGESPSQTVFAEKAAVDGFHHVEVQVVGDGAGHVQHLWERDCSVQRRFQKIVECAPARVQDRKLIAQVIESALKMAQELRYRSLGTFEFLVSESLNQFYFLEINPRIQVEHTITECTTGVDLVQTQLLLAQGHTLRDLGLDGQRDVSSPPASHAIQLRLCAEDPDANFALSIGKVMDLRIPSGHGVRVDTHEPSVVGSDFDNLLAKIIVTGSTWEAAVRKAQRVLADSRISGIKTNLNLLRGIVSHKDFVAGRIDTQWLETQLQEILESSKSLQSTDGLFANSQRTESRSPPAMPSSSSLLFRKGDAWAISLEPLDKASKENGQLRHHLRLSRVLRNEFPSLLTAEIDYTTPSAPGGAKYKLHLETTSSSASALVSSGHPRGDPKNPQHIVLPLSGKLIEVLVAAGDEVVENQVLAYVKQMKMELEVRSPRSGRVNWALEMEEDEEDVAEGVLLVEMEGDDESSRASTTPMIKGKL